MQKKAIELYEKETGHKMPSYQVATDEWRDGYIRWLERTVV